MSDALRTFVDKAKKKHGNTFSYHKFEYINAKTRSVILCPQHGEFTQTPDKHLNTTYPCPTCLNQHRKDSKLGIALSCKRELLSRDEFLKRLNPSCYQIDTTNYVGLTQGTVDIVCEKHGRSTYVPRSLLTSKHKCKQCANELRAKAKTRGYEDFLAKAEKVHTSSYVYPESNAASYLNRKSVVEIICPVHGIFRKKAQKHLLGQGCFKCKVDELVNNGVLGGGYCPGFFRKNPDKVLSKSVVYYLQLGDYYKIGITVNLSARLKSLKSQAAAEPKVLEILALPLQESYLLEQYVLETYKNFRIRSNFSTELFCINVLENKSLKELVNCIHLPVPHTR
jgi:hypothetical protein